MGHLVVEVAGEEVLGTIISSGVDEEVPEEGEIMTGYALVPCIGPLYYVNSIYNLNGCSSPLFWVH